MLHFTGILSRVDNLIYDVGQKLHIETAPSDVVIVAIDEYSLSQLGRWPWPRNIHADLIRRLKADGAAVIGMDIIFSEPDNNKAADDDLAAAITDAKNVVLPILFESTRVNGQVIETLPVAQFAEHAADLGRVHAVLDEDGIARSIYLYEGVGAPVWQHFSQAVLNVAQKNTSKNTFAEPINTDSTASSNSLFSLKQKDQRKINFLGPAGHFSTMSYVQVLNGQFEKGVFRQKIVLVGNI